MFSLLLSAKPFMGDRLFIGDWFFLGDTWGWSWRAASGARADSMAESAAAAGGPAAAGWAAGNGRDARRPLYPLRSWRQNGRLATHSPRHAHLCPPPRFYWLVPRVGPRLPLWWRRREEGPVLRFGANGARARRESARGPAPLLQQLLHGELRVRDLRLALPEKGSAAVEESTVRVWVRELNLSLGYRAGNGT